MRRPRLWALVLLVGLGAACSDRLTTPSYRVELDPSLNVQPTGSLDQEISTLSYDLFPKGLETAAGTRWETVKQKYAAGATDPAQMRVAQQMLLELATWIQGKTAQMDQPSTGETRATAAARLVTYMAMYVYGGPNTPIPVFNPEADATFGVVLPTQPAKITTPAGLAGVGLGTGSVAVPAIITITQNPNPYFGNCNGPLPTPLCQYPLFYDFHIYPEQPLLQPGNIAVCPVPPGSYRRPLGEEDDEHDPVHERLRLAHPAPAALANRVAGGYVDGDIEILPSSAAAGSTGVSCAGQPEYEPWPSVNTFASLLRRVFVPEPLYAVDQGPEHRFQAFSPFNLVDPQSQPDLSVDDAAVSYGTPTLLPGGAADLTFTIANRSPRFGGYATAKAGTASAAIYFSNDATWDATDVLLSTPSINVPALIPDQQHTRTNYSITIPSSAVPGTRYVIVKVTPAAGPLADLNAANDVAAVDVVISSPTSEPPEPTGGITGTVVLRPTNLSIGGPSGSYHATIVNGGPQVAGVELQGWIVQGSVSHPTGDKPVNCGAGSGILPAGTCSGSFTVNLKKNTEGLAPGAATFQLRLVQGATTLATLATPVNLQSP